MRTQDWIFLAVTFSTMLLGVLFPGLAKPLALVPRFTMMGLLFFCFLSIEPLDAWRGMKAAPAEVVSLAALKLLVLPLLCWALFRVIMPEYALGALLLGGASVGVIAPFFGLMLKADFVLLLVNVVLTSLLLPLTLPFMTKLLSSEGNFSLPFWEMTGMLCVTIFIPFVLAQALRRMAEPLSDFLLRHRANLALALMGCGNFAIFSRYATVLRQEPAVILPAFLAACIMAVLLFTLGVLCTWRMALEKQLAFMIGFTIMNNILMLILSAEFFSVTEALMAALYAVPFYTLLIPLQLFRRLRGAKD